MRLAFWSVPGHRYVPGAPVSLRASTGCLRFDPLNGADQGGSTGANWDNVICVDPNDVHGSGVKRCRALAGKVMPLVDGGDTA